MAYRRRQGMSRASTFKEEIVHRPPDDNSASSSASLLQSSKTFSASSSLAAQAIRASALSHERSRSKDFTAYDDSSTKSGFWGVLARKAKAILDEDGVAEQADMPGEIRSQSSYDSSGSQFQQPYQSSDSSSRMENPKFRKGLDAITTSLNNLGDTFEKAFEEGRTMVESKTADIKLQMKRRGDHPEAQNQASFGANQNNSWQQPKTQTNHDNQLKASRDVAMATAAKAKLLLRELKTVKADLAFAKERCSQLEEENKHLRENRDKGNHKADDDLIRLQLETLLAEKARLANENSVYARENRFLREIVEYHQLTMQDVVYLGDEEVSEVYPLTSPTGVSRMLSISPGSSPPPTPPPEDLSPVTTPTKEMLPVLTHNPQENKDVYANDVTPNSDVSVPQKEDVKKPSLAEDAKTPSVEEDAKTPPVAEDTKRPPASSA